MKKLFLFLPIFFFCFSCNESDDLLAPASKDDASRPGPVIYRADPTKLAKVVFYSGTDRNWFFYPNGLLKKITKQDGTLVQTFTYDSNNNLIATQRIGQYTYTFNYDTGNHITSVNGGPITYDAGLNHYFYYYALSNPNDINQREITLNNEGLVTFEISSLITEFDNDVWHGMYAGYSASGNMTYVSNWTDPSGPSYSHDDHVNPLKAAMLPVCRAMSVVSGSYLDRFMLGEFNSVNNVVFNGYGSSDPESIAYSIEYNANNLPYKITQNFYYFDTLEYTGLYAKYYYQGDAIPNN